jgi:HK97 family phage portal protein
LAFWKRLGVFLSGASNRQAGLQSGEPQRFTDTALPVTLDSAMQLSAVFACLRLLSETVASLPINVYMVSEDGTRSPAKDHPLHKLLNGGKINKWQTRQEFFETMTYQLAAKGNAYAVIQRNGSKEVIGLLPLMSEQMEIKLNDNGTIEYRYTDGANVNVYSQEKIWHVKLMGNGVIGLSPLDYARSSIGIGQAAEKAVTGVYKNGGKPSGILTIDKVIQKEQRDQIKQTFAEMASGNQSRLFVLEAGMQYHQVSLSPQDIELLASRRFQIEDICRFFGVPSVLVNDTSAGTTWGSGIQQIVQGFYKLGLRPYLERYEASMKAWLVAPEERAEIEIEFDFNALLRPDMAERMKMYKEGIQGGVITPNEGRAMEGLVKLEGGDKLLVQKQMIPVEQAAIEVANNGQV